MSVIYEKVIVVNELQVGSQSGAGSSATRPSIKFGDGDSGIYENGDDTIGFTINGTEKVFINSEGINGNLAGSFAALNETATGTNPTLCPSRSDLNSGIGNGGAADRLGLIAGGVEAMRFTEVSSRILQFHDLKEGQTADAGSAQGNGVITCTYNVYSTVGVAGDCATLPATFAIGTIVYIKNDAAANSMDVFPANGDDAGAGANTAVAVAAGNFAVFVGTVANATWTKLMGGTA